MKDVLTYKDFIGSVRFSASDELLHGKIEGINDLVTYEATSVKALKKAFKEAVEDYIELCQKVGKEVFRSFKGTFNVRIDSALHAEAFHYALLHGITLNQFVKSAIESKLESGALKKTKPVKKYKLKKMAVDNMLNEPKAPRKKSGSKKKK